MVLLTVTKAMLEAIRFCEANTGQERFVLSESGASGLGRLELGDTIGHERLIDISRCVRNCQGLDHQATGARPKPITSSALDSLLRHSRVFVKPPAPKDEPSPEHRALMAKLREQEENAAYERMLDTAHTGTIAKGINPGYPALNTLSNMKTPATLTEEEDEMTYADVNRQMALIINVLLSIVACSVAIWNVAGQFSVPQRLGLSMSGSSLVGIAEVVVYAGYVRRLRDAKRREKLRPERKRIMETWVIGGSETAVAKVSLASHETDGGLRHRKHMK